jgi:hypothetical protein
MQIKPFISDKQLHLSRIAFKDNVAQQTRLALGFTSFFMGIMPMARCQTDNRSSGYKPQIGIGVVIPGCLRGQETESWIQAVHAFDYFIQSEADLQDDTGSGQSLSRKEAGAWPSSSRL